MSEGNEHFDSNGHFNSNAFADTYDNSKINVNSSNAAVLELGTGFYMCEISNISKCSLFSSSSNEKVLNEILQNDLDENKNTIEKEEVNKKLVDNEKKKEIFPKLVEEIEIKTDENQEELEKILEKQLKADEENEKLIQENKKLMIKTEKLFKKIEENEKLIKANKDKKMQQIKENKEYEKKESKNKLEPTKEKLEKYNEDIDENYLDALNKQNVFDSKYE